MKGMFAVCSVLYVCSVFAVCSVLYVWLCCMFDCCVVKGMIMDVVCNMGSVCMMSGEHHWVCMCETSAMIRLHMWDKCNVCSVCTWYFVSYHTFCLLLHVSLPLYLVLYYSVTHANWPQFAPCYYPLLSSPYSYSPLTNHLILGLWNAHQTTEPPRLWCRQKL